MGSRATKSTWLEGNWHQLQGAIKQYWSKLTDDDLGQIKGVEQKLKGALMKKYAYTEEQAQKAIEDFKRSHTGKV